MYYRDNDSNDFGGFLVFLLIGFVFLYVAIYIGGIILLIFAAIGAAISFIYSFIIYIRAAINAGKIIKYQKAPFLQKWGSFVLVSSKNAFIENFQVVSQSFQYSKMYRFLSFKKWMWLSTSLASLIFGNLFILFIAIIQVGAAFMLIFALAILLAISYLVPIFIYLIYSLVFEIKILFGVIKHSNPIKNACFNKKTRFKFLKRFAKNYFLDFKVVLQNFHTNISNKCSSNKNNSSFSTNIFTKLLYSVSPISLYLVFGIYSLIFIVIFILLFLIIFILQTIWCLISLIIHKIKK